ncbi:hypothetical protein MP228_003562 [Amoeboaphelidium protococcarum]|nr:hypothetical protein MP228_003562 [Amoeboaphelidium protococcarum]
MDSVAPILGVLTATGIYISPFQQIYRLFVSKNVPSVQVLATLNPISFAMMPCNALAWTMYGLLPILRNPYLFWSNVIGCLIGMFYFITVFHQFSLYRCAGSVGGISAAVPSKLFQTTARTMVILFMSGLSLILFASFAAFIQIPNSGVDGADQISKQIMGWCCILILVIFYAAPMSTLFQVLKSRDASVFSLPLLIASVINACLWTFYGYFGLSEPDPYIWCPNLVGVLVSLVQFACKFAFRNSIPFSNPYGEVEGGQQSSVIGDNDQFAGDDDEKLSDPYQLSPTNSVKVKQSPRQGAM